MQISTFLVERWMSTYENDIRLNLAESSIKQLKLGELLDMAAAAGIQDARAAMERIVLTYDETRGTRELRELIAALYPGATGENVLITNGAIEANYLLFHTLVQPGDTVITMFPAYQQLYSVAEAIGANVKRWEVRWEKGYVPDLADLDALLDDRTRLIVLNTPHNPTGAVLTPEQVQAVVARAERLGAYVMCDETYQHISLDGSALAPGIRPLSPRAISVGTMSKNLGLAGLRIGWVVAGADVVQRCWAYRDYCSICSGRLSDWLAVLAARIYPQLIQRTVEIGRRNFAIADRFMREHTQYFEYIQPRAGLLMFPRLRLPVDSETFCKRLIHEEGVLLVPGSAFEKEGFFRLGFGDDTGHLTEGLEKLHGWLERHYGA